MAKARPLEGCNGCRYLVHVHLAGGFYRCSFNHDVHHAFGMEERRKDCLWFKAESVQQRMEV